MTALTTSPSQLSSWQDLFGNIRIPSITALATSQSPQVAGGDWVSVPRSEVFPYSSLLGIPVQIPSLGNSSFNIQTRYQGISCSSLVWLENNTAMWDGFPSGHGLTFWVQIVSQTQNGSIDFNLTSYPDTGRDSGSFAECTLTFHDVESAIACYDKSCHVTAMRNTTDPEPYPTKAASSALQDLPYASVGSKFRASVSGYSSLSEVWLHDPTASLNTAQWVNLSTIPLEVFSQRLEMLQNTFFQATYWPDVLTGSPNYTTLDPEGNYSATYNETLAQVTQVDGQQYQTNYTFAAILIVISIFLLVQALASLVLTSMTLAPDIFGYVSSSTRDNPFFAEGNKQPSSMDGLERARAMARVKVALADVRGDADSVGHVAFVPVGEAWELVKGRRYD